MPELLDRRELDSATVGASEAVKIIGVLTGHFAASVLSDPLPIDQNPIPALFGRLWNILERIGPIVEQAGPILNNLGGPADTVDLDIDFPDTSYGAEWKAIFASEVPWHNAHAAVLGLAAQFFHCALWSLVRNLRPGLLREPQTLPKLGTAAWKEMVGGYVRVWSHKVTDCRMFPWLQKPGTLLGRIEREHSLALRMLRRARKAGGVNMAGREPCGRSKRARAARNKSGVGGRPASPEIAARNRKIIKMFGAGKSINDVCQRYPEVSKENARRIKSDAGLGARKTRKNRQS